MKIKATKKILSLVLAVMMVMSSFAMMFVYAEDDAPAADAPVTTPKAYADAEDGEKLYDVDFNSEYYTHVDDSTTHFPKGTTYAVDGSVYTGFKNGWHKALNADAVVAEGNALKVDFADMNNSDSRYIGYIGAYDLENSTYTYQFEYFRTAAYKTADETSVTAAARSKFYFGAGTFQNLAYCDCDMPCLGVEFNATGGRLMRQSSASAGFTGCPVYKVVDNNGVSETTAQVKVVLTGGAKMENVTFYGQNISDATGIYPDTPAEGTKTWKGDAIPVQFTIYTTQTFEDGTQVDVRHSSYTMYQPVGLGLVFGVGEYNKLTAGQYYGARNLAIYKGDTSIPYESQFASDYAAAGWGDRKSVV